MLILVTLNHHYSVLYLSIIDVVFMGHLWQLRSNAVMNICTSWRKALRNIWRVNGRTHCNIIASLSVYLPLEDALKHRFQKFHDNMLQTGSDFLKMIIQNALKNPFSIYCDIVVEVKLFQENSRDIIMERKMDTEAKVNVIKELIDIRDQTSNCNMLSVEEVSEMIDCLCTS